MQKLIPSLWFDMQCEEAMNFYVSIFSNFPGKKSESKIVSIKRYEKGMETPGIEQMVGKVLTGIFELEGYRFMALDGGPIFKFNPSVSFILNFDPSKDTHAKESIDTVWEKISAGGKVFMEYQKYPFSEKYGWCEDKFGLSWQLMLTDPKGEERPFIIPSLLFVKKKSGKTKEARDFYLSVFSAKGRSAFGGNASKAGAMVPFEEDSQFNQKKGDVMFSDFMLENQWFAAMDGGDPHDFDFNEAISFLVNCKDQAEVDRLWDKLSAVPESEVCGWLKDKYGVSWQIIPEKMGEMLSDPDKQKAHKVMNAMLKMKKISLADLEAAYNS